MRKIIVLACAIACMASVIPATASAHWLSKAEAARAIDNVTDDYLTFRPARRNCVRFNAHKIKCVADHVDLWCVATFTTVLRGDTIYVSRPQGVRCQ